MDDQKKSLLTTVGAGVLGVLIGVAAGSGADEDAKRMSKAVASVEEQIAGMSADTGAKLDAIVEEMGAGRELAGAERGILGEGQAALDTKLAEMATRVDGLESMLADLSAAKLTSEDVAEAVAAGYDARYDDSADEEAVAAAEDAAEAEDPEAAADDSPEPSGTSADLTLSPGETAIIGEGRFFLSQITADSVKGKIVGGDMVEMSVFGDTIQVGGCTLAIESLADGTANLTSEC